jgi:ectoine hydroxylase-related dioxygenase (phytanoyl-CoA dioxygenase family)
VNNLKLKEKRFFRDNGYLHLRSVIPLNKIYRFRNTFFDLLTDFSGLKIKKNFDDLKLKDILKKFRKKNKTKFFKFFRTVSLTKTFCDLYNHEKINEISSELLKTRITDLIIAESQFRLDEPNDKLFNLDWHQDASYYKQDSKGTSSLVINITVQNQIYEMGTPLIKVGSHKSGKKKIRVLKNKSKVLQLMPSRMFINNPNYKTAFIKSKPGDIVIYDMRLLHKSGYNKSKKVRFSVLARAFNPFSQNFKTFRYISKILN